MNALELAVRNAAIFNDEWDCEAGAGDFSVVPFTGRPHLEILEGVCHELAHAVTLQVGLGKKLMNRIGDRFRALHGADRHDEADLLEIYAHAIVMGVFSRLGVPFDRSDFVAAAKVQVRPMSCRELNATLADYERTDGYAVFPVPEDHPFWAAYAKWWEKHRPPPDPSVPPLGIKKG